MIEITEGSQEFLELEKKYPTKIDKIEEELIHQKAITKRLQEERWEVFDRVTNETKANLLLLASNAWTEGLDNVEGSLSSDKGKTALAEGRLANPK